MSRVNALSVDVEDYWSIFSRDWLGKLSEQSDAAVRNTEWFLETLSDHGVKATFFVLGEVAEKFPALIKRIAEEGHEIGVHGFHHKQIFRLTESEFRQEVGNCKRLIEDTISGVVAGHRAPAFSMTPQTKWALEILADEGFGYDSSVFPISGKRYGWPAFGGDIRKIDLPSGRNIIEVPMSTVTVLGKTLPAAGGGYIRHFPYAVTKWTINHIQKKRPAIVYMHPYEVDTEPKVFDTEHLARQKKTRAMKFHRMQMRNRSTVAGKLIRLLSDFEFTTIGEVIGKVITD
jgi:polysaccharide deacetylase family protein (PEP-CTERM system associated)